VGWFVRPIIDGWSPASGPFASVLVPALAVGLLLVTVGAVARLAPSAFDRRARWAFGGSLVVFFSAWRGLPLADRYGGVDALVPVAVSGLLSLFVVGLLSAWFGVRLSREGAIPRSLGVLLALVVPAGFVTAATGARYLTEVFALYPLVWVAVGVACRDERPAVE
jgi:hypothetical protein